MDKTETSPPASKRRTNGSVSRPKELEDWLNRNLYHRLSIILARALAGTFISPNMVSVAGGLIVVLAGLVYYWFDSAVGAVFGLLLHMGWHVLDGADGDLARLTGCESRYGEMVDGLCDYASHLILYILLAAVLADQIGWIGWVLMIATGLIRIPQTVFYETQRRQYQWWVYGKEWLRVSGEERGASARFCGLAKFYLTVSSMLEAGGRKLDTLLEQGAPGEREAIVKSIEARYRPLLRALALLSSNYRTLGIGVAMIVGSPLFYVMFEMVVLTIWTLILMRRTRSAITSLADQAAARIAR